MAKLTIFNRHDHTMTIQVDPSANTYYLAAKDCISFVIEGPSDEVQFYYCDYSDDFRVVTVMPDDDYYIIRNGTKLHCDDYPGD